MKEFIICFTENRWYSLEISTDDLNEDHNISSRNKYYTFQVSDLIREIKSKNLMIIPEIINIESFDKQFSQKGKDLLDFKKWHILKALRREEIIKSNYRITDLKDFLIKIKELINKLKDESENEMERFNEVEIKINKIIHKASFGGIKIDREILNQKCIDLHKSIYDLKNDFQFSYNIFQPENFETQADHLKSKKYKIIESVERTVNLLRKADSVCEKFNRLNKYSSDLKTLVMLKSRLGGNNFVNPYYLGFGSITSRIIIKEPSLQNLRKENRNVIISNDGKELFYIDYSQFEASILAHCSSDNKILDVINNSDIYNEITSKIYNKEINEESRKESKILFYRYLYGDTFEYDSKFKKQVESYFNNFSTLLDFKDKLIESSKRDGHVRTDNGNFRKLDIDNDNIWILSHYIQSKASYIFKKAIIKTYENVKKARLLIPLHDGALYEIDSEYSEKIKPQIIDVFIKTFQNECNSLKNVQAREQTFYKT